MIKRRLSYRLHGGAGGQIVRRRVSLLSTFVSTTLFASILVGGASPLFSGVSSSAANDQGSARGPLSAITGFVRDQATNLGIPNATVHIQARPTPVVTTLGDGSFIFFPTEPGPQVITASFAYDRNSAVNYATGGADASPGDTGVVIELEPVPLLDNNTYEPGGSDLCSACHGQIHDDWSTSSHSRAATNDWVLDLFSGSGTAGGSEGYVFKDTHDSNDTGFCATCHAPRADAFNPGNVMLDEVTGAALEGVNCLACHQIDSVEGDPNALHHLGSATYRFPDAGADILTDLSVWGPLDDVTAGAMSAVAAPYFKQPRLCASCHQYNNPNSGAPGQSTFDEWLASPFAVSGPNYRTCQDCHEPAALTESIACEQDPVLRPGDQIRMHTFEGSTPPQLQEAFRLDASGRVVGNELRIDVEVENVGAGHSFPTGVSIRNGLLVVEATFRGEKLLQTAGAILPFYASDDVPGEHPGDFAGEAGKGYARVLQGRINGEGPTVRPVLFIDAESVFSDTRLPSGETDMQSFGFAVPEDASAEEEVSVTVRLLYRRAFRALAVTKGWEITPGGFPVEIEMAREELRVGAVQTNPLEIPATSTWGLVVLAGLLGGVALRRLIT